ncbi:MAG: hypothetical protein F7C34_04095 [Desulfurococcales archaeon]|nr:hypothetical protein [Desulfurococcales archaeon]
MRQTRALAVIVLVMISLLTVPAYVVNAQEVYLNYALVNNTISIDTVHYHIELDANAGGIVNMTLKNDLGDTYDVLVNASIPLLSIAINNMTLRNGSLQVVGEENDRVLVVEVVYDAGNLTVRERLYFYSWTPLINVNIEANNTIENLSIIIPVSIYTSNNESINLIYSYIENGNFTSKVIASSGVHIIKSNEVPVAYSLVSIETLGNQTGHGNVSFFEGASFRSAVAMKKLIINSTEANNTRQYIAEVVYGNVTSVYLDLLATNYLPAVLAIPPFAAAVESVADLGKNLDMIARLQKYINDLEDRIETLNSTIKNLQNRLADVQKQLDNYKGCEDHYKQEIKARDYQIQRLQERLHKTGLIEASVFIIGIILGVIAGVYIIKNKCR